MIPWIDRQGFVWPWDDPESIVGMLPGFLDYGDPRPAREQIDERYIYGGWHPSPAQLKLENYPDDPILTYPQDPPLRWLATAQLREELLLLFECSYVAIVQPDGSYEIARID